MSVNTAVDVGLFFLIAACAVECVDGNLVLALRKTCKLLAQRERVLVVRSGVLLVTVQRCCCPALNRRSVLVAASRVEIVVDDKISDTLPSYALVVYSNID